MNWLAKIKRTTTRTHCQDCRHPKHSPGKCEALDGGWNPRGYCWCPDALAPIERMAGDTSYEKL